LTPHRILVFRIGSLGDTIVAIPAFWRIRQAFPDAHIAFLSNSDLRTTGYVQPSHILPANGLFDEWLTYPSNVGSARFAIESGKLLFKLRKSKFDSLVYLMPRTRTENQIQRDRFFFRMAGISNIFGMDHLRTDRLEMHAKFPSPVVEREGDFIWDCLSADGFPLPDTKRSFDLCLTWDETESAENWLRANLAGQGEQRTIVAAAPGSKWSSKIWPEQNYVETVSRLIRSHDVTPVIFGGPEDRPAGERLIAKWGRGANAAGQLDVRQAAAALRSCALYFGNDTGTMHIAAAVGTPCVAIFASIDWDGRWYPAGEGHRTLRTSIECEGCHLQECPFNNECLRQISIDQAYSACSDVLKTP
jgi:heptosyltransferase III